MAGPAATAIVALYRIGDAFYLWGVEAMGKCPTCKGAVPLGPAGGPYRPFCSERCRLVDLGSWLDGAYRIGAPVSEEDLDGGLPDGQDSSGQDSSGHDQSGDDSSN